MSRNLQLSNVFVYLTTLIIFSSNSTATASDIFTRNFKKKYNIAEKYFNNENFEKALPLFIYLDSIQKDNANLKYKIGYCYLNAPLDKAKAIPYFIDAVKNISPNYQKNSFKEKAAPKTAFKYLAYAYQLNYEFDKAIAMYLKYKETLGSSRKLTSELEDLMHCIETCSNGVELVKSPKNTAIKNLGEHINTIFPEYSPVILSDGTSMYFTSRRLAGNRDVLNIKGEYDEDIFVSELSSNKWKPATLGNSEINSEGNERVINTFSQDQFLILCKDDGGDGNLYISNNLNGVWKSPHYWGEANVNGIADESYGSLTSDDRILYFVSNREGGYGGSDIYKCLKLPNGKWGPPQNLGPIVNTKYDEDGVFVNSEGKELFFSSKGYKSMGGFDVFSSVIDPENGFLSPPLNVGYPINSTGDDLYFKTNTNGRTAYISSDRAKGFGGMDIYEINYPEESEQRDITLLMGRIINNSKEDLSDNLILVIDKNNHEIIQEVEANNATGKFGIDLPIGTIYEIQYFIKGKEIYNETLETKKGNGYQVIIRDIPYGN